MATSNSQYLFNVAAKDILAQANRSASAESQRALKAFVTVFTSAVERSQKTRITSLYQAVAAEATTSIVRAYQRRPYKTRSSIENIPYRNEHRYSGGKLLAALGSPAMYNVTATGIKFINTQHLRSSAAQWKRLNFGAGSRGSQTPPGRHYKMRIFGQVLPGDFGLFDIGPEPSFKLPPGYWSSQFPGKAPVGWDPSRRGHDFFILGSPVGPVRGETSSQRGRKIGQVMRRAPTTSLGIQGSRFLDVGVGRLVQLFPVVLEGLLREWFAEAKAGGGPVFKSTVVPSGRTIAEVNRFSAQIKQQRDQNIRIRNFSGGLFS